MDDLLFARELAAVLSAAPYSALADLFRPAGGGDPLILAAQSAAVTGRPLLTISGDYTPYGPVHRRGELTLESRGRVGDDITGAHYVQVSAILTALIGARGADDAASAASFAAAVAALQSALLARGAVGLLALGPAQNFCVSSIDGEDLVTLLTFRAAWAFQPPI